MENERAALFLAARRGFPARCRQALRSEYRFVDQFFKGRAVAVALGLAAAPPAAQVSS
jgi:hypothetical protein